MESATIDAGDPYAQTCAADGKGTHKAGTRLVGALLVALAFVAVQLAMAQPGSASTGVPCPQTGNELVATDESAYAPGSLVHVTGMGYAPNCDLVVKVTRPDGSVVTGDGTFTPGSDTVVTDFLGGFSYDYQLQSNPAVEGQYLVDVLGEADSVLAHTSFEDANATLALYRDSAHTAANEDYLYPAGGTVFAHAAALTNGNSYKLEVKDQTGASRSLSSCFTATGAAATLDGSFTTLATDLSNANDFQYILHEWNSTNCTTGAKADTTKAFDVAKATVYSNPSLTIQQSSFGSGSALSGTVAKTSGGTTLTGTGTLFVSQLSVGSVISVPHTGGTDVRRVTAIGNNTSLTVNLAWSATASAQTATKLSQAYVSVSGYETGTNQNNVTWNLPGGGLACKNTAGGNADRPDSSNSGGLPSSLPQYLEYVPSGNAATDQWNALSNYDAPNVCPLFSSSNQGQWTLTLFQDSTHFVTLNVFSVDTAKPEVTINQTPAGAAGDPTTAATIHFTAVFSEPVTGFSAADVTLSGTAGATTKAVTELAPNNGTTYDVAVTGMTQRGTVIASIPADGAADAAGNTNNGSTSTDNTVTWDRIPATTAPIFSPSSPKTNDSLQASTTTSDPDGDNVSVAWTWKVDRGGDVCTIQTNSSTSAAAGIRVASLSLSTNYAPTSCTGTMINPLNPSKGDSVIVEATPNDGLFDGTKQSSNVTIANTAPVVALSGTNTLSPNEGTTYTYNYSISDADGDTIASVATSCGTGSKTNAANTNTSGSFDCTFADGPASTSVSAQATDSGFGATAGNTDTQAVTVDNVAPTVTLTGTSPVTEGSTHTYSYTTSDPGDEVFSRDAQSCDGGTLSGATFNSATGAGSFDCTYADGPSSHNPSVTVSDGDGGSDSDSFAVTVDNVAPTVTFDAGNDTSVDESGTTQHTYNFTVSDPGQDTFSVNTPTYPNCGAGGSYVSGSLSTDASGGSFKCIFPDGPATTNVAIKVTDSDGASDSASEAVQIVDVANVPPTATLSNNGPVNEGSPATVTFTNQFDPSGPDTTAGFRYEYNCDGSVFAATADYSTADTSASHQCTFNDNGSYTVRARIIDQNDGFTSYTTSVSVNNVAPSIPNLVAPADNATTGDNTPTFDWSNSTDPAGANDTITYRIQVDNNCNFSSPERDQTTTSSDFTPLASLADGTYCWRVNASDEDGGTSAYSSVRSLTIDTGFPTALSINRAGSDPTNASSVSWTVKFSESVSGVDSTDFALVQGGGVSGASITGVSGSGDTYTVSADTGSGNGTLGLNLVDNDSISDGAGNNLGGTGAGNGSFTGQVYTIDKTAPTVTVTAPLSPQTASTVHFTATVNETTVDTIGNGDITVAGSAGATTGTVTGTGPTYDIAVSGMTMTGTITVKVNANAVSDAAGNPNAASNTASVQWNQTVSTNNAPVVTITSPAPYSLYAKPANVNLSASFTDPDAGQTHTCSISWDDGSTTTPAVSPDSTPTTPGTCAQNHAYSTAGVYTIVVTVCDNFSPQGCDSDEVMIVVYDASAGFITGGGWITVDPGSYPANPTLTGRANFGFNSQYKKGSTVPTGETEFQFQVGNLNFHSSAYSWLVVSGYKAQYKGTGTVNGVSGYDFTLTAYDGAIAGAGQSGYDRFRIKITKNGVTVFDNRNGASMDMDAANPQNIGGGSIVIHKA